MSTNIDWVAMLVSCSERLIHSEGTRRSTIFSLAWTIKGASSIDSTSAATTTCDSAGDSSRAWSICDSSTKPNSPPAHNHKPVRAAVPWALPSTRDAAPAIMNLPNSSAASIASTAGRLRMICPTSRNIPTVTKNRPSSTSRKGLMSSSTW